MNSCYFCPKVTRFPPLASWPKQIPQNYTNMDVKAKEGWSKRVEMDKSEGQEQSQTESKVTRTKC